MKTLKVLLALALALACPGAANADYTICNGNSCRTVRTPVRNTASRVVQWAAPARYSTGSTVVRTYRRGLFGRRVYTGYATVSSPQASYGSSGTTTTTYYTSEPTSGYGSTGATTSYGSAGSTTSYATPPTLQNTTKSSQVETVSTPPMGDCDCNGECNCPCCPCKPTAKKPDDLNLRLSTKRLQIPTFQLAKKLHVPDLRLAAR